MGDNNKKFAHIEEVENGFIMSTNEGTFVFTSGNTMLKEARKALGLTKDKEEAAE